MKTLISLVKPIEAINIGWLIVVIIIYFDFTKRIDVAKEKVNDSIQNQYQMIDLQYQLQRKLDSINQSERYEEAKFKVIKDSIRAWTSNEQRRQFISDRLHKSTK